MENDKHDVMSLVAAILLGLATLPLLFVSCDRPGPTTGCSATCPATCQAVCCGKALREECPQGCEGCK